MKFKNLMILLFVCLCGFVAGTSCMLFAQADNEGETGEAESMPVPVQVQVQEAATIEKVIEPKAEPVASKNTPAPAEKAAAEEAIAYVGSEKCKVCHPNEYEDQSKRKHAKSWKILEMRGEENNPECVKCHATGAGRPGGFISAEKTPYLTGKQCEACHGPGAAHVKKPNDPALREKLKASNKEKNVCLECHLCMTTHRTISF